MLPSLTLIARTGFAVLSVERVCLDGNEATAFDHAFTPGEMTVVLGGNLSGKTNLCRLLAGLPTQACGDVSYNAQPLTRLPPQRRSVAVVFQAFVNYPNWTVAQNIASPMIAQGLAREEQEQRIHTLAQTLGIGDFLDRSPDELSGGQQQRLAIARALAQQADVLVLDEPLVNLDYKLREALILELKALLSETQATVIYTSSDPRDAFALGDQVLLLKQNQKLQAGTPLQVYQHPANLAAAHLMSDPGVNRLPLIKQDDAGTCRAVRPEHIRLGSEPPPPADVELNFDMQVDSVERSGDETFLHGTVFDPQYPGATEHWVVRRPGMHSVDVGQVLALYVRHDDILTLVED